MERLDWLSIRQPKSDYFQWCQDQQIQKIEMHLSDLRLDGILPNITRDIANEFEITATSNTSSPYLVLDISLGVAYKNNKRIQIATLVDDYDASAMITHPYVSSGCQNIPIEDSITTLSDYTLYVYIRFFEQEESSIYTIVAGNPNYFAKKDGYKIEWYTTAQSDVDLVFLGTVKKLNTEVSYIGRTYANIHYNKLAIDDVLNTLKSSIENEISMITTNGIVSDRAECLEVKIEEAGGDKILVSSFISGESAIINGKLVESLDTNVIIDFPTDSIYREYIIRVSSDGVLSKVEYDVNYISSKEYLELAKVGCKDGNLFYPSTTIDKNNITVVDLRKFSVIGDSNLQNLALKNVNTIPFGFHVIDYRDGTYGITINYLDPENKISKFVLEKYFNGSWITVTEVTK